MKKAIYLIIALIGLSAPSCSDSMLDFSPTDSGSGKELLKSASTAITSVNGVYRSMWTAGWSTTANTHQCFGIAAYNLALDCMADDLIMQSQGNGWFWGDHCYNVKSNYTSSAFRSYDVWYANYKWIANVNYIIDAEPEMAGTEADVAYVAGQAYAIRALCYLNLATWFSRAPYNSLTGASRWNEPCVPVYTTGTSIDTADSPANRCARSTAVSTRTSTVPSNCSKRPGKPRWPRITNRTSTSTWPWASSRAPVWRKATGTGHSRRPSA